MTDSVSDHSYYGTLTIKRDDCVEVLIIEFKKIESLYKSITNNGLSFITVKGLSPTDLWFSNDLYQEARDNSRSGGATARWMWKNLNV